MFSKILVPVDLTQKNTGAISVARDLAQHDGGEIVLLHVIETLEVPFEELREFYDRLEENAQVRLEDLAEPLRSAGINCTKSIVFGTRVPEIVFHAQNEGCDLIVISSHKLNPDNAQKTWTSISHQVAILAQTPVLVLK